jgi:hypothetical protein
LSYLPFLTEDRDVGCKWIFPTIKTGRTSKAKPTNDFQGSVIHMTTNSRIETIFKEMFLSEFRHDVRHDCPSFGRSAVTALLPLGSSNLGEPCFSAMAKIKTRQRNCLQPE